MDIVSQARRLTAERAIAQPSYSLDGLIQLLEAGHHTDHNAMLAVLELERLRAENAAKDRRIAELEELLRYIHDYSNDGYIVTRVEAALSGGGGCSLYGVLIRYYCGNFYYV